MSFFIAAPHKLPQTQIELPSPELGNDKKIHGNLILKEALDGDFRTYVRKTTRKRMRYTFRVDYPKYHEIKEFYKVYCAEQLRVIDHNDVTYKGYFVPNTLDFSVIRRPEVTIELDLEEL